MEDSIQVQSVINKRLREDNGGRVADTTVNLEVTTVNPSDVTQDIPKYSSVAYVTDAPTEQNYEHSIPFTHSITKHPD